MMNAKVRDVMTGEVVAVRRDTSFKEMAARLRQYRVSAFPVVDEHHRVIGVVSEADLLARRRWRATTPGSRPPSPASCTTRSTTRPRASSRAT